jgi:hypothetical protein
VVWSSELQDVRGGRRCRVVVAAHSLSLPPPPDVCGFGRSQWQSVVGYVAWWLLSADGGFVDASWWSCSPLPLAHVDLSVAY